MSLYPANELWNLVPADRMFNQHRKRGRLPSLARLQTAEPILTQSYANYLSSPDLERAMREDVKVRFRHLAGGDVSARDVARAAVAFIDRVGGYRNIARF